MERKFNDQILCREICQSDLDFVYEMVMGEMGSQYAISMRDELHDCLSGKAYGYVAQKLGLIVGYVCWRIREDSLYLETIVVSPNVRSQGLGTYLLGIVEGETQLLGYKYINLITDSDSENVQTINFYLKNGFDIKGYISSDLEQKADKIILRKSFL